MPTFPKPPILPVSADDIADKISRGEDITTYFTNNFIVVNPSHWVNSDLTQGVLQQFDDHSDPAEAGKE